MLDLKSIDVKLVNSLVGDIELPSYKEMNHGCPNQLVLPSQ